jgi:hypothetical protein
MRASQSGSQVMTFPNQPLASPIHKFGTIENGIGSFWNDSKDFALMGANEKEAKI